MLQQPAHRWVSSTRNVFIPGLPAVLFFAYAWSQLVLTICIPWSPLSDGEVFLEYDGVPIFAWLDHYRFLPFNLN